MNATNETSHDKLSALKGHLSLQSHRTDSQRESKVRTVPLLISDAIDVQMMMDQIEETNRALSRLTKSPLDFWLKNEECLEFFGVSDTTLRHWRQRGKIAYSQHERLIMFHWPDIEKFLLANRKETFSCKR